ncbi:MAG: ATP-binding protein [Gemmatimonadota bacterium]|nr:HAMP domain-containing protein [Gemmatimonadota bacterium]
MPFRRTLLLSIGILYVSLLALAAVSLYLMLPWLGSVARGILFAFALLVLSVGFLWAFGGALLSRTLLGPLDRLVSDAQRIAGGDYRHRITPAPTAELAALSEAVNAMAARLIHDQELLAENVRSLEETNRELIDASDEVIRSARLASVGTLASGIAHEIGNPLSAVIGFVDLARSRSERGVIDPDLLQSALEEARRIDGIVRSLLHYARPRDEQRRPVDTVEVLLRVRNLLENQGRFDLVPVTWSLPQETPPVEMNPQELEQVMVNLLLNALDALEGRKDARIWVSVDVMDGELYRAPSRRESDPPGVNYSHRRRISWDAGGLRVEPLQITERIVTITVRDNGPGIPEDHVPQLFDPFFTTKEPGKGTGLGLAVCSRLVEGMGGRIEGGNHEEGGARFLVRLPVVDPGEAGALAVEPMEGQESA